MNTENAIQWFDQIYQYIYQAINWVLINPDAKWIKALIIVVFFLTLRNLIKKFIVLNIETLVLRKHPDIRMELIKELEEPLKFLPIALGLYFALLSLTPNSVFWLNIQHNIIRTLWIFSSFWIIYNIVNPIAMIMNNYSKKFTTPVVEWIIKFFRIVLVFTGFALILEIWGVQIGPIIAGLGLFGMAVALGAKDLFKNILAGITIISEKRFAVGDRIKVEKSDEVTGTVEHIGFRSTKIRKYDQAPIYIPNSELADFAVINLSERQNRRIEWIVSLEYRTSVMQLQAIRNEIETYLLQDEGIQKGKLPFQVKISEFSKSSIDLLIYCFTTSDRWAEYLVIKERLVIAIKNIVDCYGAHFAYPSQSLYIEQNLDYASKRGKISEKQVKETEKKLEKTKQKIKDEKKLHK